MKRVRVYKGDNSLLGEFDLGGGGIVKISIDDSDSLFSIEELKFLGLRVEKFQEKPKKLYQWVIQRENGHCFIDPELRSTKKEVQALWMNNKVLGIVIRNTDGSVTWKEE